MWFKEILNKNKPIMALAPMANMTDLPFCHICRQVAGKDFVIFREMVSSEAVVRENEKTLRMCKFEKKERPIVQQIFGSNPKTIARAAGIIIEKFSPSGIDINMGCPVPKLTAKVNSGAALMKDHDLAVCIVKALKKANLGVPVSVKTRLGWGSEDEILEFAPKLESAGADLISIHGRTKKQGYSGKANWEMIGKVKEKLSIPVIANGDIKTTEDIEKCLEITGADGIMIGRGALGDPWILNTSKKILLQERIDIVLLHAKLHVEHYGERGIITFRKHLAWYFKGNRIGQEVSGIKELRKRLVRVNSIEELESILDIFFSTKGSIE